jgi:hypothetical protein
MLADPNKDGFATRSEANRIEKVVGDWTAVRRTAAGW